MARQKKNSTSGSTDRDTIVAFLNKEMQTDRIKDFSCNGLQVQGSSAVKKIGLAVDACMQSFTEAASNNCQMLITHHGIIWDGIRSISGTVYSQVKFLLDNNLNLYASHLPLDLHPKLGNNAVLSSIIGLKQLKPFGMYKGIEIGFEGVLPQEKTLDSVVNTLCVKLNAECTVLPFGKKKIKRIAIVSGGASGELSEAIAKGVDCYITGESSHENYHAALEAKINVIYCGHYHSETVGVKALGNVLASRFGTETVFIDIPTSI